MSYLDCFVNYEFCLERLSLRDFSLYRVERLLSSLCVPVSGMKVIHIAGSNGKGMVANLTASILKEAGYRVGLYTSPHIQDIRERIRILDKDRGSSDNRCLFADTITASELDDIAEQIHVCIEGISDRKANKYFTFFEVCTALALLYFYRNNVDFVVLETGLGGRLDATNVVSSIVAAITSISIDHVGILGNTLEKITAEKAAIIKDSSQRVVICKQSPEAMAVIERRCKKFKIEPLLVGRDITYDIISSDINGTVFDIIDTLADKLYSGLKLSIAGCHQVANVATTFGIIKQLRQRAEIISDDAIYQGILSVYLPCRFEVISRNPYIILDGAHNKAAAAALADTVSRVVSARDVTIVLGISKDKDISGIANELNRIATRVIFTIANHPRAVIVSIDEARAMFPGKDVFFSDNVREALGLAMDKTSIDGCVLVTGSFFVTAEARLFLLTDAIDDRFTF